MSRVANRWACINRRRPSSPPGTRLDGQSIEDVPGVLACVLVGLSPADPIADGSCQSRNASMDRHRDGAAIHERTPEKRVLDILFDPRVAQVWLRLPSLVHVGGRPVVVG